MHDAAQLLTVKHYKGVVKNSISSRWMQCWVCFICF